MPNDPFVKVVWQKLLEAETEHSAPTYQRGNMYGTPGGLNDSERLNTILQRLREIDRSSPTPAKKAEAVHSLLKENRNEKEELQFMRPLDKFVNTVLRDESYKPLLEQQRKQTKATAEPILPQHQAAAGKAEQQFKGDLASKVASSKEKEPEKAKKSKIKFGGPSAPDFD